MAVVVFLRGMNLGKRRLSNDELAAAFTRLGYADPTPYQASGNVILPSIDSLDSETLSAGLEHELGYDVPVFARSGSAVQTLAADSPFSGARGKDGGKPQIVFLHEAPSARLEDIFGPDDQFELIGTEIHWLPPAGLADTGKLHAALDAATGGTTVRTLGTLERIAKKLS